MSLSDSNCCSEPDSYAPVEEDGTCGFVMEVFDDLDKVGADVVLPHGYPQSCMPNPVEGLLEVYEDMVEVLLVLEIFPIDNIHMLTICSVALLLTLKPACSSAMIFSELNCRQTDTEDDQPILRKEVEATA